MFLTLCLDCSSFSLALCAEHSACRAWQRSWLAASAARASLLRLSSSAAADACSITGVSQQLSHVRSRLCLQGRITVCWHDIAARAGQNHNISLPMAKTPTVGRVGHTLKLLNSAAYQALKAHCVRSGTGGSCVTFPSASSFCRRCACSSATATRRWKASRACSRLLTCACTVCSAAAAAVASACSLSSLLCNSAILSCSRVDEYHVRLFWAALRYTIITWTVSCNCVHSLQSSRWAQHASCYDKLSYDVKVRNYLGAGSVSSRHGLLVTKLLLRHGSLLQELPLQLPHLMLYDASSGACHKVASIW